MSNTNSVTLTTTEAKLQRKIEALAKTVLEQEKAIAAMKRGNNLVLQYYCEQSNERIFLIVSSSTCMVLSWWIVRCMLEANKSLLKVAT